MTKPACKSQMASPFASGFSKYLHPGAKDPDAQLPDLLQQGVISTVRASPSRHLLMTINLTAHLLHCQGSWTQAEHNPDVLQALLQQELQAGWIRSFTGDSKAAQAHWAEGTATGKLNIVMAEGKGPRLALDSTVCNANTLRKVPERVQLPTALDAQRTFQCTDKFGQQQLHCRDTLRLGTATLRLGSAVSFYTMSTFPKPGACTSISAARRNISSISAFISGPFPLPFPASCPLPFLLSYPLPFPVQFRFNFRLHVRFHFRFHCRSISGSCPAHFRFIAASISAFISGPFPPVHFRFHFRPISGLFPVHVRCMSASISGSISAFISAFNSGSCPFSFPAHFRFHFPLISVHFRSSSASMSAFISGSISGPFPCFMSGPFPLSCPAHFRFHFRHNSVHFRFDFRPISASMSGPISDSILAFISASISGSIPAHFRFHFRFHFRLISVFISGTFRFHFRFHFRFRFRSISGSLPFHFRSISGSFPVHPFYFRLHFRFHFRLISAFISGPFLLSYPLSIPAHFRLHFRLMPLSFPVHFLMSRPISPFMCPFPVHFRSISGSLPILVRISRYLKFSTFLRD